MSVIEQIVAQTQALVAQRKAKTPLADVQARPRSAARGFCRALRMGPTGLILECKQASPSQGLIRANYDPAAIAASYAEVASCISVLTAEPYFQGSLDHLRAVRAAVELPLLCKDFITDPYQLHEARAYGADAALLICAALDDPQLRDLLQICAEIGLDALVEVHDGAELQRALSSGAHLVGINNRNLKTLEVSLTTSETLAPRVPPTITLVAESGISGRADLRRLRPLVDAFLIGTHVMRQGAVQHGIRELAYGRIKICGLKCADDARLAWQLGASYGGLLFAKNSPRFVDREAAREIVASAPLRWVGVFVNERPERICELATELGLAAVQLHGEESAEEIAGLRQQLPAGCELWKAHRVQQGVPIPTARDLGADRLLLDSYHPTLPGGTGIGFDWRLVEGHPERHSLVLAGGLGPDTIAAAEALGTWALDLSSKVERAPGVKSPEALAALFSQLRGRGRSGTQASPPAEHP